MGIPVLSCDAFVYYLERPGLERTQAAQFDSLCLRVQTSVFVHGFRKAGLKESQVFRNPFSVSHNLLWVTGFIPSRTQTCTGSQCLLPRLLPLPLCLARPHLGSKYIKLDSVHRSDEKKWEGFVLEKKEPDDL